MKSPSTQPSTTPSSGIVTESAARCELMDVTVREGSYAAGFQLSALDVSRVISALDDAGVPLIEVGHGVGLGLFESSGRTDIPLISDAEHVRAARGVIKSAKLGVLALATTTREQIAAVRDEIDFMRVAAPVYAIEKAAANVAYAKSLGLTVYLQMMQSSTLPLDEVVEAARRAEQMGPDAIYVVDTFGHLLPGDVRKLVEALRRAIRSAIGFHAHNNMMLGVANSVAAIEAGAQLVDGSLLGVGREAGNAQLEAIAAVLDRQGASSRVDVKQLLRATLLVPRAIATRPGVAPLHLAAAVHNISVFPEQAFISAARDAEVDLFDLVEQLGAQAPGHTDIDTALSAMKADRDAGNDCLGARSTAP